MHDRTAGGSPELLRLSLAAIGRSGELGAVAPGEKVIPQENRVEIRRAGLVEWYLNSEAGLEQGFTLEQPPSGDGLLVVELAVAGAQPALRGDAVVFETAKRRKLRYGELVATDAAQQRLAAHFELASAQRLRIVVDDAGATYPVVIDPLLTEAADAQLALHAPATGAIPADPAHGPWRRLDAQAVEADIRLPEPGWLLSLASGFALSAALARRGRNYSIR